jgi:hypothetical protein
MMMQLRDERTTLVSAHGSSALASSMFDPPIIPPLHITIFAAGEPKLKHLKQRNARHGIVLKQPQPK